MVLSDPNDEGIGNFDLRSKVKCGGMKKRTRIIRCLQ